MASVKQFHLPEDVVRGLLTMHADIVSLEYTVEEVLGRAAGVRVNNRAGMAERGVRGALQDLDFVGDIDTSSAASATETD